MAAPKQCELRRVYLAGHALLLLGFTFYVAGFSTSGWIETDSATFGLWWVCGQGSCTENKTWVPGWLNGARAMLSLGFICYLVAFLLALVVHCLSYTRCCTIRNVFAKWVLEIFAGTGSCFSFVGICLMGRNGDDIGALKSSFFLSAASLVLIVTGTFMTGCTRRGVARSIQRVSPQIDDPPTSQSPEAGYLPPIPETRSFLTARGEWPSLVSRDAHGHPDQLTSQPEARRNSRRRHSPHLAPPDPWQHLPRQVTSANSFPISQIPALLPSAPAPGENPPSYAEAVNTGYI